MGRSANAYNFLATKFTIQEVRSWLTKNDKEYNDSDYGSTKDDHFEIICQWAYHNNIKDGHRGVFSSVNYGDNTINGLYYGVKLNDVYLHASADGYTSVEEYHFSSISMIADSLHSEMPEKKFELVTIQTMG
jgi:hypothetical protein